MNPNLSPVPAGALATQPRTTSKTSNNLMKNPHLSRLRKLLYFYAVLLMPALAPSGLYAATYTWGGASAGLWSTAGNWSPAGGPPTTGDTANIVPGSSLSGINYDASASGSVGNFNFTSSSGAQTILDLNRDLTLGSGTSVISATTAGTSARLRLNGTSTLTIGSGAVLEIGVNSTSEQAAYTAIQVNTGYTGTGTTVNGELKLINGTTGAQGFVLAGPVTVSGGTLTAQGNTAVENPTFTGNFTTTGAATIQATTMGSSTPTSTKFTFQGASNSFGASTIFTGVANAQTLGYNGSTGLVFNPTAATPTQSLTMGVVQDFAVLNSTASLVATETFTSTATSNGIGQVTLNNSVSGVSGSPTKTTFKLGGNLAYTGNLASSPFAFVFNSGSYMTEAIDLAGFSYDSGVKSFAPFPSGAGSGIGSNFVQIVNSGSSSLSGGQGLFKAAKFGFTQTNLEVGIGSGVILQATGTGLNDLGHGTSGQQIDPSSTFYYTAVGTSALKSNRDIGGLTVGTGSSASVLELSSNITAGGVTTVNAGATLNLTNPTGTSLGTAGTYTLTTTGLAGAGTITNNATGAVATTVTVNGSGSNTFSGSITDLDAGHALGLTLSSGNQTLGSGGTYTYHGATTLNGGKLLVNGSLSNSAVTVNNAATLGGSGTVAGSVTVNSGGTLAPGNSPGILTVGSLVLNSGATTVFEINGTVTRGTDFDGINIANSDSLTYGGTLEFTFGNVSALGNSSVLDLFNFTASNPGAFANVTSTGFYSGTWTNDVPSSTWSLNSGGQTLTFSQLTGDLTIVPEPSTCLLFLLGAGALLARNRVRRVRGNCGVC